MHSKNLIPFSLSRSSRVLYSLRNTKSYSESFMLFDCFSIALESSLDSTFLVLKLRSGILSRVMPPWRVLLSVKSVLFFIVREVMESSAPSCW